MDRWLAIGVAAVLLYYLTSWPRLDARMVGVDPVLFQDRLFGFGLIAIMLVGVRRAVGWSLLSVILVFLGVAFMGRILPGWTSYTWVPELIKYSGFTASDAVEHFTMTPHGLLGVTTSTSLTFVFYFVMFGAIYSGIGGGQLFIDFGLRLAGRQRGGAAKTAVVSSGLMGSISGSAVANVATTGLFTIPLMRRAGYGATRAGAIEAIASTGGQLMPPIMGVAAFVMADLQGENYGTIALAGLIPALAFYWSVFLAVDLHARREGLEIVVPDAAAGEPIARRLYLLLPVVVLVGLLFWGLSASLCAVYAMASCVVVGMLRSHLRFRDWLGVILKGVRQAAEVAIPIAAIGIVIEVAVQSNLVLKFSLNLIGPSAGTMLGAMLCIILGCLLMGMGLPTVAAYVIGAILFVPALLDLGIPELAAHFFVMYYCVLSMVTPPIALASYTAAGLAGAPVMKTCFVALRLSIVAFVIPVAFVFSPALLAQGSVGTVMAQCALLFAGTSIWAVAVEGYLLKRLLGIVQRLLLGGVALAIILLPVSAHALQQRFGHSPALAWVEVSVVAVAGAAIGLLWCLGKGRQIDEA